jgi:FkbM family methyltransferase
MPRGVVWDLTFNTATALTVRGTIGENICVVIDSASKGRMADAWLARPFWRVLFASDRLLGVQRSRDMASAVFQLGRRWSDRSYWKTANRLSPRLRNVNPALVKVPPRWALAAPVVRARRLGLDLELDLRDNLLALVFYCGAYEPSFTRHLHSEIRSGDVYADVGAHIGIHALHVAQRLAERGGGHVLAFEPAADSAEKLRAAALRNRLDVRVVQLALSNRSGELGLFADERYDSHDAGVRSAHATGRRVATAAAMTFDDWAVQERLDHLDIVKIDVEGHEAAVLEGMRHSLARFAPRAVYIEIKANSTGRSLVSDEALRALAADLGYRPTGESYDHNELFRPAQPTELRSRHAECVLAVQRYRTPSPVTARPMIMRWISEAPSKIVKLSGPTSCDQDLCS